MARTKPRKQHLKPKRYASWLTLQEFADAVERDPSTIRRLEENGRIPKAQRYRVGKLKIRLWHPDQVKEVKEILTTIKAGRPRKI